MGLVVRMLTIYFIVLLFCQFGCGGSAADASIGSAQVMSLSPNAVTAGSSAFTLLVNGANFSSSSVILLNGNPQATTLVSSGQLTAQISSVDVAKASVDSVAVENASPGRQSNTVSLTICNPLRLATNQLPPAATGNDYSAPLSATGGLAPYHWSVSSGSLPDGLAMDSQTGAISGIPGSTGDSAFTAWVTDSMNSRATANLSIDVSAGTQAGGGSSVSGYYGAGLGSDGVANTTIGPDGNTVSLRFRAKHSGAVPQARVYFIPDHPGYAAGTGGNILVTLNQDDGTPAHNPSSTVLGSYVVSNILSLSSPDRYFYAIKFANPPTLTAGQLYHIVFTNVDDSPSDNYLSVNALYQINVPSPAQPTTSNIDAAVLLKEGGNAWSPRGFTPIYELDFANGVSEGIGYMEGWIGAPQIVSGSNAIREIFTVSGAQVKVSSVSIRLARLSGSDPLEVRLENADGSLIEQGNVEATTVPLSSSSTPAYAWTTYIFSAPYTLAPGNTYHLDFEATSTSTYQAFPIRKGNSDGFSNTTFFPDGYAEFEQNGTWSGWTQWGVTNRTDGDLQFYFSVAN